MLSDLTIKDFMEKLSSEDPTPGGGSVAALNAATAASLISMVARLSLKNCTSENKDEMNRILSDSLKAKDSFLGLVEDDSRAFESVMLSYKLPKATEEQKEYRSRRIQDSLKKAATVPFTVARDALIMFEDALWLAKNGNPNAQSDAICAAFSTYNAIQGALLNVQINLLSIRDEKFKKDFTSEVKLIRQKASDHLSLIHRSGMSLETN